MLQLLFRRKVIFFLIFFSCSIFYILNLQGWHWYKMVKAKDCETPEIYMKELKSLFKDAHGILNQFQLTHLLIYGRFVISQFHKINYKEYYQKEKENC